MYARRLGAKLAVSTETAPPTIPRIAENFERNDFKVSDCILKFLDAFKDGAKFDEILCNMICCELWLLRDNIEDLLAEDSELIILSQFLTEKDYILKRFEKARFKVVQERVSTESCSYTPNFTGSFTY